MLVGGDFLIPEWPEGLQLVDIVKARFVLNFTTACQVQPADFLEVGRSLRLAGRQFLDSNDVVALRQWQALFEPPLSDDPIARRKFQKPAPAFVITTPIMQQKYFGVGDSLDLEVLFIGTGIPLIRDFLRSLIHLGNLGLVAGQGRFGVTEVFSENPDHTAGLVWRQNESIEAFACSVQSLAWLFRDVRVDSRVILKFITPMRLIVDGKPLRKPGFRQVFPFMLRRVTSMLYAHAGVEVLDDPTHLLDVVQTLDEVEHKLHWHDWYCLNKGQGATIGGFLGKMTLAGEAIKEVYWVFSVAALLGAGKGATYGAGRFELRS